MNLIKIIFFVFFVIYVPLLVIYALNTLFPALSIIFSIENWLAMLFLILLFKVQVVTKTQNIILNNPTVNDKNEADDIKKDETII